MITFMSLFVLRRIAVVGIGTLAYAKTPATTVAGKTGQIMLLVI